MSQPTRRVPRLVRRLATRTSQAGLPGLWLLARACFWLLAARLALAWLPVARIVAWKQRPIRQPRPAAPDQLHKVRWAVLVVARWSPLRLVCFPQCLAAGQLLRSMHVESRLHYGVRREGTGLVTHTWLEVQGEILIGGEAAAQYNELAVY